MKTTDKLTEKQKRHLRGLAHALKPVVIIGNAGLTENIQKEIDQTLEHHELIKIRINAADRTGRAAMLEQILNESNALLVQSIGHIAAIYRTAKQPKLQLPRA